MLGQIVYERDRAGQLVCGRVADTAVLSAYVPQGKSVQGAFLACRTAKRFQKQGIHLAAFPKG